MISLSFIFWTGLAGALVGFWWQSDKVRGFAYQHALGYCREHDLQLLDQSLVLVGVKPVRGESGGLHLRRRYRFEFATTGETRYKGWVELFGVRLNRFEVEPHVLPGSDIDDRVH